MEESYTNAALNGGCGACRKRALRSKPVAELSASGKERLCKRAVKNLLGSGAVLDLITKGLKWQADKLNQAHALREKQYAQIESLKQLKAAKGGYSWDDFKGDFRTLFSSPFMPLGIGLLAKRVKNRKEINKLKSQMGLSSDRPAPVFADEAQVAESDAIQAANKARKKEEMKRIFGKEVADRLDERTADRTTPPDIHLPFRGMGAIDWKKYVGNTRLPEDILANMPHIFREIPAKNPMAYK